MLFKGKWNILSIPKIIINDTVIAQTHQTKFLGVILDDRFSWIPHIDFISKKVSKAIGILQKLKLYLNTTSLVNMYYAFIFPYLHYCNEVWGGTYTSTLKRLIILQKRSIRIISRSAFLDHTDPIFVDLKILRLRQINLFVLGRFMYRAHFCDLPSIFDSLFIRNSNIYNYNTRQRRGFHVPKVTTNLMKMTVRYKGVILWNHILRHVDHNCSFDTFKRNLKRYLFDNPMLTFKTC